jgi:hypothetical protein
MKNAFIERFKCPFRPGVHYAYIFEDIYQLWEITDEWLEDYNHAQEPINNLPALKYQSTKSTFVC